MNIDYMLCTGCSACENICPVNAISMKIDKEGFLYPSIEGNNCIDCGVCMRACHIYATKSRKNQILGCYAVWAPNEIREVSSSGGAFSLIANYIIDHQGYVCGASFEDNTTVKHIVVDNKQELGRLRTSKYVQSNIGTVYKEIKNLIDNKKVILFSGTPCQVEGLYLYLGFDPECLYTVDILCHGVPSQNLFKRYLLEEYKGKDIKKVNFRDKSNGWTYKLNMRIETKSDTYIVDINEDAYYSAFNNRLSLRKSCGVCDFANPNRVGDISLGDFWEIWAYDKSLDDRKGTSLLLVNSEKGKFMFQNIIPEANKVVKVPLESAMKGNPTLYKSIPLHKNRENFFEDLKKYTLKKAVENNVGKR